MPPEQPDAAGTGWRRLSARMLLIHPVREITRALPALIGLLVAGSSTGSGQLWAAVGVVAVVAFSVLRWATTRFRFTADQVQLHTGLLRRKSIVTPADRVRTVDVTASALHRLLGLAKVQIGTGDKDSGLELDALTAAEAAHLRAELLHRTQVAHQQDAPEYAAQLADTPLADTSLAQPRPPTAPPGEEVLLRFDPAWVRYAPFTTTGLVAAAAILGAGWQLLNEIGGQDRELGVARWLLGHVRETELWLNVVQGVLAAAVFVTVLAVGGYVLAYWGFRVTRHRQGTLHIARGLLTTRATSIEERRLRGVELNDTLLLRIPRGARLEAVTTGLSGKPGQEGSKVLVPPAPVGVAAAVAARVLGTAEPVSVTLAEHGPAARRRRYLRALAPVGLLAVAVGGLVAGGRPPWLLAAVPVLLAASLLLARDRYRSLGHALSAGYLVARAGSVSRSRAIVATDGIIGWNLTQTLFQRRAGLATLVATTAAGDQAYPVTDVAEEQAVRVARAATPGLLDQFLAG